MRPLSFKTPAYRLYAPWLYRWTKLRARIESLLFGLGEGGADLLTSLYWDRYLARRFEEEAKTVGGLPASSAPPVRRSDRVFVLGCGASIADIPPETWDKIGDFDSIGVNYFYFHPFRPSCHFIELGVSDVSFHALHDELLNAQARRGERVYLQIRHLLRNEVDLQTAPDRAYLYSPMVPRTKDMPLLSRLLRRYYLRSGREPLLHHASNLDCAINFAARQGYKEIYLLGVDLSGNQYFWDVDDSEPSYARARAAIDADYRALNWDRAPDAIHATANSKITDRLGVLDIGSYLKLVDEQVLRPAGVRFAVCNPKSLLVEYIDYCSLDEALAER